MRMMSSIVLLYCPISHILQENESLVVVELYVDLCARSIPPKFTYPSQAASARKCPPPGGYYCIYLVEKYPPLGPAQPPAQIYPPQGRIHHKDLLCTFTLSISADKIVAEA